MITMRPANGRYQDVPVGGQENRFRLEWVDSGPNGSAARSRDCIFVCTAGGLNVRAPAGRGIQSFVIPVAMNGRANDLANV